MTPATTGDGARPMAARPTPIERGPGRARSTRTGVAAASSRRARTPTSDPAPKAANRRPSANASPPKWTRTSHGSPTTVGPVKARLMRGREDDDRAHDRVAEHASRALDERGAGPTVALVATGLGSARRATLRGRPGVRASRPSGRTTGRAPRRRTTAASMTNAAPTPISATAKPAIAGPTVPTSWPVPCITALAAARRSAGTSRGTSVLIAGRKTASTVPNAMPTTARCQIWTWAPSTSAATIVVKHRTKDVRGEGEVARRDPVGRARHRGA